jgi:hypothetical protein
MAARKPAATGDNDLFRQALIGAALSFAPSLEALEAETARRMMVLQGVPDVFDAFRVPPAEPARKPRAGQPAKAKGNAAPKKTRGRRTPLDPSTPITEALAGVRRNGAFAANGITTLADASGYRESDLTAIKGIGVGLIAAIKEALPRASLELRAEG